MARQTFDVEIGFGIDDENGSNPIQIIRGSAVPGSAQRENDAIQGSLYLRDNGELYLKYLAGSGTDRWIRQATLNDVTALNWRADLVRAATGDAAPSSPTTFDIVVNPFGDDDSPVLGPSDFAIGEFILYGVGGTPKLMEVTNIVGDDITVQDATNAIADNDVMVIRNYLPDNPDDQEKQAIVLYNGTDIVKISDFNFAVATGINTSVGYAASSGDPASGDTVEVVLEKLDGNNDAQDTLLGTAQGDTDLGTFPGNTIPDSSSVKGALQSIENAYEETDQNVDDLITLSGVAENATDLGTFPGGVISDSVDVKTALTELEAKDESQDTTISEIDQNVDDLISLSGVAENSTNLGAFTGFGAILLTATETVKTAFQKILDFLGNLRSVEVTGVNSSTVIDSVPVASVGSCVWQVHAFEEATPTNRAARVIHAINDGATNTDDTVYAKLKVGTVPGTFLQLSTDISGGNMRLLADSSTAGITVRARRIAVEDV